MSSPSTAAPTMAAVAAAAVLALHPGAASASGAYCPGSVVEESGGCASLCHGGAAWAFEGFACNAHNVNGQLQHALVPGGYEASLDTETCWNEKCLWGKCVEVIGCRPVCTYTMYDTCCAGFKPRPPPGARGLDWLWEDAADDECNQCTGEQCPEGYFRSGSCAVGQARNDFRCDECSNLACPASQYRTGSCGGTHDGYGCAPHAQCGAGQWLRGAGATTAGACNSCPPGTFRAEATHREGACAAHTPCGDGEYELRPPTATSNRVCTVHTACAAGEFESAPPSAAADRECTGLTECVPGQYVATAATATADRVCRDCDGKEAYQPDPNQPGCLEMRRCGKGELIAAEGSRTADHQCGPCPGGQYRGWAGHRKRVCTLQPSCPPGTFISPDSKTERRVCTACPAGTFMPDDEHQRLACRAHATSTCGPDTYIANFGSSTEGQRCEPCPPGTHQPLDRHTERSCPQTTTTTTATATSATATATSTSASATTATTATTTSRTVTTTTTSSTTTTTTRTRTTRTRTSATGTTVTTATATTSSATVTTDTDTSSTTTTTDSTSSTPSATSTSTSSGTSSTASSTSLSSTSVSASTTTASGTTPSGTGTTGTTIASTVVTGTSSTASVTPPAASVADKVAADPFTAAARPDDVTGSTTSPAAMLGSDELATAAANSAADPTGEDSGAGAGANGGGEDGAFVVRVLLGVLLAMVLVGAAVYTYHRGRRDEAGLGGGLRRRGSLYAAGGRGMVSTAVTLNNPAFGGPARYSEPPPYQLAVEALIASTGSIEVANPTVLAAEMEERSAIPNPTYGLPDVIDPVHGSVTGVARAGSGEYAEAEAVAEEALYAVAPDFASAPRAAVGDSYALYDVPLDDPQVGTEPAYASGDGRGDPVYAEGVEPEPAYADGAENSGSLRSNSSNFELSADRGLRLKSVRRFNPLAAPGDA